MIYSIQKLVEYSLLGLEKKNLNTNLCTILICYTKRLIAL